MSDPLYPGATQALLTPEATTEPQIVPAVAILHTHGSPGTSANVGRWFDREDVSTEAHFSVAQSGEVFQFMPVDRQADAQWAGNGWWRDGRHLGGVSIETEDGGDALTPWTDEQCEAIAALLAWLHATHDIPLVKTTSASGWGVGHHRLFAAWNRSNHGCPGPVREAQLYDRVLPRAVELASGDAPAPTPEPAPEPAPAPKPAPTPAPKPKPAPKTLLETIVSKLDTLDLGDVTARSSTWLRGDAVRTLQCLLVARGHAPANTIDDDGDVDGIAGPGTKAALAKFQRATKTGKANGQADHVVGPKTWTALIAEA